MAQKPPPPPLWHFLPQAPSVGRDGTKGRCGIRRFADRCQREKNLIRGDIIRRHSVCLPSLRRTILAGSLPAIASSIPDNFTRGSLQCSRTFTPDVRPGENQPGTVRHLPSSARTSILPPAPARATFHTTSAAYFNPHSQSARDACPNPVAHSFLCIFHICIRHEKLITSVHPTGADEVWSGVP